MGSFESQKPQWALNSKIENKAKQQKQKPKEQFSKWVNLLHLAEFPSPQYPVSAFYVPFINLLDKEPEIKVWTIKMLSGLGSFYQLRK